MKIPVTSIIPKLLISGVLLTTAGVMGTVSVLSLLSDVVIGNGTINVAQNVINHDTLDITGAYQVYMNGSTTPELTNTVTMQPGDIAVIKATITNVGNLSSWIKDDMLFKYTYVESGSPLVFSPGIKAASDFESMNIGSYGIYSWGGVMALDGDGLTGQFYTTDTRVLNGIGTNAQIETPLNAPASLVLDVSDYPEYPEFGYNEAMFTNSNSYDIAYTVYFDPDIATTGSENFTFSAKTQAMQYRTNNAAFPTTTCDAGDPPVCTSTWDVVVSSPTGL